jgi:3-(3-hydroxy-phenyl)propionate hydroxylase
MMPRMRPAGRHETDSLYFTYPHFDAPGPDTARRGHHSVIIAGAGPIGMTTALTLAGEGVPVLLLDRKDTFNDGSRAICIARSSFHILERIGALPPFLDKALGWTTGRSFYRGEQILEFHMPDSPDEKFRPMYNLQQQYIEAFLWQAVAAHPLIETRWQTEVTGVTDDDTGVMVTLHDPKGTYTLTADWLLAADGARSPIRSMRGLRLKGENYEGRYVIADVQMDHAYPTIRRALFDPACRPGGTVLIHRQPDHIWRIDYQLRDGETAQEAMKEDTVRASVAAVLQDIGHTDPWELEWWSVYSANTLALDDYRDGRIFFVGDSAHIVPIFGVRGLNNGLADAHNIGWKLGWVLTGRAGQGLLDSYTPERRGATLDVFANATKSTRFMTPPTRGWQILRDAALSLSLHAPWAGQLANPRQMQPYTYANSPATLPDDPAFCGGPVPGAVIPCLALDQGDHLTDRMGPGFNLISFGPAPIRDLPGLTVLELAPDSHAATVCAAQPGSAFLIRPDLHIAARWHAAPSAQIVLAAMTKIITTPETPR